jgi:nucleoside-diphosphate-sugar epimerase
MSRKIIVTGSSGYVASALVPVLLGQTGVQVVGIDRAPTPAGPSGKGYGPGFQFVRCDLSSPGSSLDLECLDGADACIHLAAARGDWAISDEEYWRDNRDATASLLSAAWARGVPSWIFMSSVSVYGPSESALAESAAQTPIGPYGESKMASEQLFKAFIAEHGLRGCSIRPSAIFSPGHPPNTNVYKLIESLRRFPMPLIGGGHNRKSLTYLPNLVELVLWLLNTATRQPPAHDTYNCVEEPVMTVRELIDELRQAGIRPARQLPVPLWLAIALAYPFFGLARLIDVDLRITPERVRKFAASTWHDSSLLAVDGFRASVQLPMAIRTTAQWHLDGKAENRWQATK